jgi:hypothetical protein
MVSHTGRLSARTGRAVLALSRDSEIEEGSSRPKMTGQSWAGSRLAALMTAAGLSVMGGSRQF